MTRSKTMTICDAIFSTTSRQAAIYRDIALVLGGSLLIAGCAQISIMTTLSPVPITGQTFAVLLVGALLGMKRGVLSTITYMCEGAIGIPVFAGGGSGIATIIGPSGGYILGFIVASAFVGFLAQSGWDKKLTTAFLAIFIGNWLIYIPGLIWLSRYVGLRNVIQMGLLPFIIGDIIKILLVASILPTAWKTIRLFNKQNYE